jgi:hypothetical protein
MLANFVAARMRSDRPKRCPRIAGEPGAVLHAGET